MPIQGKLELTIKITELPTDILINKNGWTEFVIDCGGRPVRTSVRPRTWAKLVEADTNWPVWAATITGALGRPIGQGGFELVDAAVQIFERKGKEPG